jgi:hypothetical protein
LTAFGLIFKADDEQAVRHSGKRTEIQRESEIKAVGNVGNSEVACSIMDSPQQPQHFNDDDGDDIVLVPCT